MVKMEGEEKLVLIWAHGDHPTRVITPDDEVSAIEFKQDYDLAEDDQKAV